MPDRIEKQITLRAPIDRVWRAVSDPTQFGLWVGVDLRSAEFKPGARARGQITYKGHEHLTLELTIERMEPPHLLAFRWHPNATDLSVDYDPEPTTLVQFQLTEVDGGTQLTIVESGFDALPEARRASAFRGNDGGWTELMTTVERHVQNTP